MRWVSSASGRAAFACWPRFVEFEQTCLRSVPLFLGVMSLPPHMDHKQFRMFSAVMLQGRESHYQRDIADLKAR